MVAIITPPAKNPTPRLKRTANQTWRGGLNTAGGRMDTPHDSLFVADNIVVTPEGSIMSRASFTNSPIPDLPSSEFVGPIQSYYNTETKKFDLLAICSGQLYMFQHGQSEWIEVPDGGDEPQIVFAQNQITSYAQYGGLICIADGENPMAYYVIPNNGIGGFVTRPGDEIQNDLLLNLHADPDALEGNYAAYYLVSYVNNFGETPATAFPDQSIRIDLVNENDPLGPWETEVQVTIANVNTQLGNNARVRVYRVLTPDFIGPSITNYQLVSERPVESFSGGTYTFVDDGTVAGRVLAPQLDNSTGGLVSRYVTEIDGRLWALGTGKEFQKIFYTGAAPTDTPFPQFFTGDGGYFYVGYGTSFKPVTIRRGRADDGQICNFALCSGPDGIGRRFNIFSLSTQYGNQTVHQFYPSEQRGDEGAYSTFGVLDYMNSILYPSPGGFKSSGIRATYTGDNVTASIDNSISDIVAAIPFSVFENMYGTVYSGKAIWHISPTRMLVFDARNNGAWTQWTLPHTWFGALSYSTDRVGLYAVSGKKVLRFADLADFRVRDNSQPTYPVRISSGRLTISPDDGREWVRLLQCLFVFSVLDGPIRIQLRANSRRRLESWTGELVVDQELFGQPYTVGNEPVEFSQVKGTDEHQRGEFGTNIPYSSGPFIMTRNQTSGLLEVRIKVNKDINFLEWTIDSLDGFLGLQLEEFVYEYVNIGVGLDFSSRYNEVRLKTTRG